MLITREFIKGSQIKCDLRIRVLGIKRKEVEVAYDLVDPDDKNIVLATLGTDKVMVGDTAYLHGIYVGLEFKD